MLDGSHFKVVQVHTLMTLSTFRFNQKVLTSIACYYS